MKLAALAAIGSLFSSTLSGCIFNQKQLERTGKTSKIQKRFNKPVAYQKSPPRELSGNWNKNPQPESFNDRDPKYKFENSNSWRNKYSIKLSYLKQLPYIQQKLTTLTIDHIRQDIVTSLYEVTMINPDISIDFDNLALNFSPYNDNQNVRNIDSFSLSFDIANLSRQTFKLFNSVSIFAESSAHIAVTMQHGRLVFETSAGATQGGSANGYYESWNIQPTTSSKIAVTINYLLGKYSGAHHELEPKNFKLLNSHSYVWNKVMVGYTDGITSGDLIKHANELISKESSEDIKKDINDWLTTYLRYQAMLVWADIESVIRYIMKPSYIDEYTNKKISILEALSTGGDGRREDILRRFNLDRNLRKLVGGLLVKKRTGEASNYKEIGAFLNYILGLDLQKILNKWLTIKTVWYEEPKINSNSRYNPTVSFSLGLDVIFNHDIIINMNGENDFMGEKIKYKGSDYLSINNIIEAFLGNDKTKQPFWQKLLKDIGQYVFINELVVKKGEFIKIKFDANNSPITFTNQSMLDTTKGLLETFGYKMTDVNVSFNFNGMSRFFSHLYDSINKIVGDFPNVLGFGIFVKSLVSAPFSLVNWLKVIDYFFMDDGERRKHNQPRGSREDRPFEKIFDYLINQNYTLESTQLIINLTRAFNYLPDKYQGIPLVKEFYSNDNWNSENASEYNQYNCFQDNVKDSTASCFKNEKELKSVSFKSGYYNNPDLDLSVLKPYNRNNDFYYSVKNLDGDTKFQDVNGFNFIWKDQLLQDLFYNRKLYTYDQQSIVFDSKKFYDELDKKLNNKSFETNDSFKSFKEEVDKLLRENLYNPNSDIKVEPEISLVRIPLEWTLRTLLNSRKRSGILASISTSQMFTSDFFKRDPYLMIINLKLGFDFFYKNSNDNIDPYQIGSLKIMLIPPKVDKNGFRCPTFVGLRLC